MRTLMYMYKVLSLEREGDDSQKQFFVYEKNKIKNKKKHIW